jgi:hypothetical protein
MASDVRPVMFPERCRDAVALFRAVLDQQYATGF